MTERERLVEIHIRLSMLDPKMLTSPDGKRIEVGIDAVRQLLDRDLGERGDKSNAAA